MNEVLSIWSKAASNFFYGLVIQKSATKTATSIKAAGDWNGLLEHNITIVIKHLQCLFVVTDENDQHWKSVQIWTILSATMISGWVA